MKCADLMNLDLRAVPVAANLHQAASIMRDHSLGFLPVCERDGRVAGVITDRDIVIRATAGDRLPSQVPVLEVMSAPPIVCDEHEDVRAAEARMVARGVSRLVVVDEDGHPLGILSLTDILRKGPGGRALETARGVLAREAQGPHRPIEGIELTAAGPSSAEPENPYEGSGTVTGYESVLAGGSTTRGMKEFPR
jgi:CBS domain-containing protein